MRYSVRLLCCPVIIAFSVIWFEGYLKVTAQFYEDNNEEKFCIIEYYEWNDKTSFNEL